MSSTVIIESHVVYWHTNMTSHNYEKKIFNELKANQYFPVRFFFIIIKNCTIIYNIIYYFEFNFPLI